MSCGKRELSVRLFLFLFLYGENFTINTIDIYVGLKPSLWIIISLSKI